MGLRGPKVKDPKQRFMSKVDTSGDCWEWLGGRKHSHGYGGFYLNGKMDFAHRVAFKLFVRDLEPNECVLHRCDNPSCVNPNHLLAGSQAENMADMRSKDRAANVGPKGSLHGSHKLVEADIPTIRARLKTESAAAVSRDYGVADTTILAIKNGTNWRHVA